MGFKDSFKQNILFVILILVGVFLIGFQIYNGIATSSLNVGGVAFTLLMLTVIGIILFVMREATQDKFDVTDIFAVLIAGGLSIGAIYIGKDFFFSGSILSDVTDTINTQIIGLPIWLLLIGIGGGYLIVNKKIKLR